MGCSLDHSKHCVPPPSRNPIVVGVPRHWPPPFLSLPLASQVKNPINGMIAAYLCDALSEAGLCAVPDQPSGFTLLIVDRTVDLEACLLHDVTYQVGPLCV